jgi:hypothetical protein
VVVQIPSLRYGMTMKGGGSGLVPVEELMQVLRLRCAALRMTILGGR